MAHEMDAPPEDDGARKSPRGKAGYRNTTLGLIILAGLLGSLGGVLAWRAGKLGGMPTARPREALRERLEARGADTPPPAVDAPSGSPAPPARAAAAPVAATPAAAATSRTTDGVAAAPAANGAARFALEVGPFNSPSEAEQVERRLNHAGYPTAQLRQQHSGSTYAVLIEKLASPKEAELLLGTLREQGFADAVVTGGGDAPLAVRAGEPLPLRGAVRLAERVRGLGHPVRVASQSSEAASFVVRHGSYPTREEAGEKGEELKRLGLANQIVRVR